MAKKKSSKKGNKNNRPANEIACVSSFLQSFKEIINKNDKDYIYCFRGQAVSNWEINSSLSRHSTLSNSSKEMYEEVIKNFPSDFHNINEFEFNDLAKMQHYSIPTNLIDVSFNPLIALFFATEKGKGKNGVQSGIVYVFKIPKEIDGKEFVKYNGSDKIFVDNANFNETLFIKTDYSNERIKRQDGAFIYNPTNDNLYEKKWIIHRFIIQNKNKLPIRNELAMLNISYRTLFPELSEYHKEIEAKLRN